MSDDLRDRLIALCKTTEVKRMSDGYNSILMRDAEEIADAILEAFDIIEKSKADWGCGSCRTCINAEVERQEAAGDRHAWEGVGMILCSECGNKRCPHANDHSNACTGSNEPGQPGSAYENTKILSESEAAELREKFAERRRERRGS